MLCQNCGENEANVRYTQIINGVKKEMALCDKCSKELGISSLDFNMPISLSSFLGEFMQADNGFLPTFANPKQLLCKQCGMSYEEFVNTGKFGCEECYEVFSDRIDPILKNLHGGNRQVGRIAKNFQPKKKQESFHQKQEPKIQEDFLEKLKKELKIAIQEERYEDAAKLRDEIKKKEQE